MLKKRQEIAGRPKSTVKSCAWILRGPPISQGRLIDGIWRNPLIANKVARGARVFLFDEPTRGLRDVAQNRKCLEQMDQLARSGAAILMVSSELPELIQVTDRIPGHTPGPADRRTATRLHGKRGPAAGR